MNKKLDTKEVRHLFEGIQELKGTEEYFCFFEDKYLFLFLFV